jgi:hypothetical protein
MASKRDLLPVFGKKLQRLILFFAIFMIVQMNQQIKAQLPRKAPAEINYDTSFLDRSPSKWSLRLYSVSKFQQFYILSNSSNTNLHYTPTINLAVGAGISYNSLNIDLGVSAIFINPESDSSNNSKKFDFIGSLYSGPNLFEIYLQTTEGMYGSTRGRGLSSVLDASRFAYRPDISVFNFGVDYNYLFRWKKFTYGTLIGTEIQKRSTGSPMVGAYFSIYNLHADSSIISKDLSQYFDSHTLITDANIFTLGVDVGYGYTVVLPAHFYLTLSLAPGIGISKSDFKANNTWYEGGNPYNVSFKLVSRGALGYGGRKFYSVLAAVNDKGLTNISHKNYFLTDVTKLKLVFGYRL